MSEGEGYGCSGVGCAGCVIDGWREGWDGMDIEYILIERV